MPDHVSVLKRVHAVVAFAHVATERQASSLKLPADTDNAQPVQPVQRGLAEH